MTEQLVVEFLSTSQGREIVQHLASILKSIRFGSIEIVVHDGRIVQIDKHEKFRVNNPAPH